MFLLMRDLYPETRRLASVILNGLSWACIVMSFVAWKDLCNYTAMAQIYRTN